MAHLNIISFMWAADSSRIGRPVHICPGVKIFTIIAMDKKTKQPQYTIHPLYISARKPDHHRCYSEIVHGYDNSN